MNGNIGLGLGIIGLGKPWGHIPGDVPSERDAMELLEFAWELGIRYFDSAPSYGIAEQRLGKFLESLNPAQRRQATIATKFGEHWDADRQQPFVDHSFEALCRSFDSSLELLGRIDLVQLHKTTPAALQSEELMRAWEYALRSGVGLLGASVSDLESAELVIGDPRYGCIQLPLNLENPRFSPCVAAATARDLWVATNRPFAMGAMLYGRHPVSQEEAFRFVLGHKFRGAVLTGTRSKAHLSQNWQAFQMAAAAR